MRDAWHVDGRLDDGRVNRGSKGPALSTSTRDYYLASVIVPVHQPDEHDSSKHNNRPSRLKDVTSIP
jgi:hypothetical protein